jgi:hypothetical protein
MAQQRKKEQIKKLPTDDPDKSDGEVAEEVKYPDLPKPSDAYRYGQQPLFYQRSSKQIAMQQL